MINFGIVANVIGILTLLLGGLMLMTLPFSYYFGAHDSPAIVISCAATILPGYMVWWYSRKANKKIGKREGYLIVALAWVAISLFSTFP